MDPSMKFGLVPVIPLLAGALLGGLFGCDTQELETEIDCFEYCKQAAECDGDVDRDECEQSCKDNLNDCMGDEREQAQNQLDSCSDKSCDEFTACTIEAGAQCYFGL
jgi:hypothetical protein